MFYNFSKIILLHWNHILKPKVINRKKKQYLYVLQF